MNLIILYVVVGAVSGALAVFLLSKRRIKKILATDTPRDPKKMKFDSVVLKEIEQDLVLLEVEQELVLKEIPSDPREVIDVNKLEVKNVVEENEVKEEIETNNENSLDIDELVTARINKETGRMILVRYKKSFTARLNLSSDENKDYYSAIKNKLLSYKKINSRVSWNYEAFNCGRIAAAKMNVRGKTLVLYLPLDVTQYEDSKYSFQDCGHVKKYANLPFRVRVKSNRGLKHAFELIEIVMSELETTEKNNVELVNYYQKNRGFDKLLQEGFIKEVLDEETYKDLTEINEEFLTSSKIRSIDVETIKDLEISEAVYNKVLSNIKNIEGKKDIINVDTISKEFEDGEVVSVKTLKEKKLIPPSVVSVKCLARGTLDKKLTFELQSYSKDAIKMILVTGGKIQ